jgi:hypothetical protein
MRQKTTPKYHDAQAPTQASVEPDQDTPLITDPITFIADKEGTAAGIQITLRQICRCNVDRRDRR